MRDTAVAWQGGCAVVGDMWVCGGVMANGPLSPFAQRKAEAEAEVQAGAPVSAQHAQERETGGKTALEKPHETPTT